MLVIEHLQIVELFAIQEEQDMLTTKNQKRKEKIKALEKEIVEMKQQNQELLLSKSIVWQATSTADPTNQLGKKYGTMIKEPQKYYLVEYLWPTLYEAPPPLKAMFKAIPWQQGSTLCTTNPCYKSSQQSLANRKGFPRVTN